MNLSAKTITASLIIPAILGFASAAFAVEPVTVTVVRWPYT